MALDRRRRADWLRTTVTTVTAPLVLSACVGRIGEPGAGGPMGGPGEGVASTVCAPTVVDATRYLRQLAFDLRGTAPTEAEYTRVRTEGRVPDELIDAMIASPEFVEQARDWHAELLWPNLSGFRITPPEIFAWDADTTNPRARGRTSFSPDPELLENAAMHPTGTISFAGTGTGDRDLRGGTGSVGCDPQLEYPALAAAGRAQPTYRVTGTDGEEREYPYYDRDGVPLPYHDAAHCPNYCTSRTDADRAAPGFRSQSTDFTAMSATRSGGGEVHELDPAGKACPSTHPYRVINVCDNRNNNGPDREFRLRRDGFRRVRAYWTEGRDVRVCSYEAQDRVASVSTGLTCAGRQVGDPSCGCGPDGAYCMPSVASGSATSSRAQFRIRDALNREPLEIVASVIGRGEDYFSIFTTRRSFINGPLAFMYRRQLSAVSGLPLGAPASMDALPDAPYSDETMREYVRGPEHAGVLTTPAYLGRFPTWRARVSQFRNSFMCRPFYGGTAPQPAPDDPCTREPNLSRRCGCQNCHAAIEPMTAWFGRWSERSARYLDPSEFPSFDPNCQLCALRGQNCTDRCRTQYITDTVDADGASAAGTLRGYMYRSSEESQRIDEGPAGLVASASASGELQSCTVRNTWGKLLGRAMSEAEMRTMLPDYVARFESSGRDYRALVRAIVTSAAYRRVD